MQRPELLAPAGSLKHQRYAYAFGADAVYAGLPRYSLRVRNNAFDRAAIGEGISVARTAGKKFYLTCNLMPHGAKLKTFLGDVTPFVELEPDALIMADPGLIMLARERWPDMPIHLSVQANTMNAQAVKFWQHCGISRVILSRELSLNEIEEIRQACTDIELEVFIHGALCVAYSGRCLLSGYLTHRDANQGACTNSCRWDYKASQVASVAPERGEHTSRHSLADEPWLLEEAERPGEMMPVYEDEAGTYIMNSKDLRAVEHVRRLIRIGIDSLKIEGRTKSYYYAARVSQAYRRAIDDALAGKNFDPTLVGELEKLSNRGYTSGFYQRHNHVDYQNYQDNASRSRSQIFVGEVIAQNTTGLATIEVKNRFAVGDNLELVTPQGNLNFILEALQDNCGNPISIAPGAGRQVRVRLPIGSQPGLLARYLHSESEDELQKSTG